MTLIKNLELLSRVLSHNTPNVIKINIMRQQIIKEEIKNDYLKKKKNKKN